LRTTLAVLLLASLVGCSHQQSSGGDASGTQDPLTLKLQGMKPEERTAYVKAHMDEVVAGAGIHVPEKKKP